MKFEEVFGRELTRTERNVVTLLKCVTIIAAYSIAVMSVPIWAQEQSFSTQDAFLYGAFLALFHVIVLYIIVQNFKSLLFRYDHRRTIIIQNNESDNYYGTQSLVLFVASIVTGIYALLELPTVVGLGPGQVPAMVFLALILLGSLAGIHGGVGAILCVKYLKHKKSFEENEDTSQTEVAHKAPRHTVLTHNNSRSRHSRLWISAPVESCQDTPAGVNQ